MNEDLKDWETNFDAIDAYKYKDESGFYYSFGGDNTYFFLRDNPYSEGLLRNMKFQPFDHNVYHFQMISKYSRVNLKTITHLKGHLFKVKHINNAKFDIDLIIKDLQERYG